MKRKPTKQEESTYDSINLPKLTIDLFSDIGAGICNSQKLSDSNNFNYDMSKVKEYKPKTKIPDIIADVLLEFNYKDDYNWNGDMEFIVERIRIEVIDYGIKTYDWCIVKMNGKENKISKKYLRELYENRTVIV